MGSTVPRSSDGDPLTVPKKSLALLDRVSGIFYTNELEIERIHTPSAPFLPLVERELALKLGIPTDKKVFWEPQHLTQLEPRIPAGQSFALYRRGTFWLATSCISLQTW